MHRLGLLLAVWLASAPARAGSLYTVDVAAVSLGQGGATVAAPDTLAAVWYNPAGLAQQRGLRLELETGIIWSPLTYDRTAAPGQPAHPRVENLDPTSSVGLAGASWDLGRDDLAVAFMAYAPSSNHYEYDVAGPQRFQGVAGHFVLAFFHAAVAVRLPGGVSLGAALGPTLFTARQTNVISAAPSGDPEADTCAVPVEIDVRAPLFFTGTLGVSWQPRPWLAVGASIMPRFDLEARGSVALELPPLVDAAAEVQGDRLGLTMPMPTVARLGVRATLREGVEVELAGVYEGWSRVDGIELAPEVVVDAPSFGLDHVEVPELVLSKQYRDVFSLRAGAEARLLPWLQVRGGSYFESSGTSETRFDVTAPEANKLGLTLGASVRPASWIAIDVAYAHTFVPEVNVEGSSVTVLNVLWPDNTRTIGDGRYRFDYDFFHLGVRIEIPRSKIAP